MNTFERKRDGCKKISHKTRNLRDPQSSNRTRYTQKQHHSGTRRTETSVGPRSGPERLVTPLALGTTTPDVHIGLLTVPTHRSYSGGGPFLTDRIPH